MNSLFINDQFNESELLKTDKKVQEKYEEIQESIKKEEKGKSGSSTIKALQE